jgi:protein-tyrosine phosphatase
MVCLGNICRSPLAEAILKQKAYAAGLSWTIQSAGTNGYHVGDAPHPLSQKIAKLKGIDISHQRARNFMAEDFQMYDKIYVMAREVIRDMRRLTKNNFDGAKIELLMNEAFPGENLDVPDPYYGHEMGYHQAYEMIEKACTAIIKKYAPDPAKTLTDQQLKD